MEDLDRKFIFRAVKTKDLTVVSQREGIIFLAKDDALLPTLNFYREECELRGASKEQIAGIRLLYERVRNWRIANPDKLKVPDVTEDEALNVCKLNELPEGEVRKK